MAVALLTGIFVTGCGARGIETTAAADPIGPTATATPSEQPADQGATAFADSPGLVNTHPVPFDSWSRGTDDKSVIVHFISGSPQCYGVHAALAETPDTIQIALTQGTVPEAVERMCPAIALHGSLDVPLENPIGDRQVLSLS